MSGEVREEWRLACVTHICRKGQEEDPGNHRHVALALVPGKVVKQIILGTVMWHLQDNVVIRPRQKEFRNGRYCLTNPMSFYEKVMLLTDGRNALDVIHLGFSKAFQHHFPHHSSGETGCS